jgi:uncharacterized protein (TIRG00374 family)
LENKGKLAISALFAVLFIALLVYFVSPQQVADVLSKADWRYLLLAALCYVGLNALMAFRIQELLGEVGHKISFRSAMEANFAGMSASDFTPARSGYFFTAFLLSSKHDIPIEKTMLAIFGPQMLEFAIKALALAVLVFVVLGQMGILGTSNPLLIIGPILGIFVIIGLFSALLFSPALLETFSFAKRVAVGRKFFFLFHLMQRNSKALLDKWAVVLGVSLLTWFLKGLEWFCLAKSLGITLNPDPLAELGLFLLIHPSITLIQFIPIPTLAGTGTSEAAFAGLLVLFGVPPATGVPFALLTRALMISIDAVAGIRTILDYIRRESIAGILEDINGVEERAGEGA